MTLWGYPVALSALAGRGSLVASAAFLCRRTRAAASGCCCRATPGMARLFCRHYVDVRWQERDVRNYHGFHTPGQ